MSEPAGAANLPFTIATAPVNWNNNDLENWRPFVPFPDILHEMRAAGYDVAEWDESFGSNVSALNAASADARVAFCGAYRWLDFQDHDVFKRDLEHIAPLLEVLQGIGARHLIVADRMRPERIAIAGSVPRDGSASLEASILPAMVERLAVLYDRAAEHGIAVHYHNHVGSYVETPSEVADFVEHLRPSPVDLCFDTGHFAFGGGDASAFLLEHLADIGYLHLKDVDPDILAEAKRNGWSFLDSLRRYIFCPLGQGNADIPTIARQLRDRKFDGIVVIEQDTCRGDSTETARGNLESLLALAGATATDRNET